jgi:hypothetical protein
LKARLKQLATADVRPDPSEAGGFASQSELAQVRKELKIAERNLALAENEKQFRAIAAIVEELRRREVSLNLATKNASLETPRNADMEIEAALQLADRLVEVGKDSGSLELAKEAIDLANAKLFLTFRPIRTKKRTLNKIAGGIVTLGAARPPVPLYDGPTSRAMLKQTKPGSANAVPEDSGRRSPTDPEPKGSGREGMSLGNVSRGDRI